MSQRRDGIRIASIEVFESRLLLSGTNPTEIADPGAGGITRAVVDIELVYDTNNNGMQDAGDDRFECSGAIIDDFHVLTAAHCVYDRDTNEFADWIYVYPARKGDDRPFGEVIATNWEVAGGWQTQPDGPHYDYDFALITLDRNIGQYTGSFDWGHVPDANMTTQDFNLLHYPAAFGFDGDTQYLSDGPIQTVTDNRFTYRLEDAWTTGGSSGGGIFFPTVSFGGQTYTNRIVGVVSHGDYVSPGESGTDTAWRLNSLWETTLNSWISDDTTPTDQADLMDHDRWFNTSTSTVSGTNLTPGGNFSVSAQVFNGGTANANGITVSFYASTDDNITAADTLIGTDVININAFESATASWSGTLPNGLTAGNYRIGWIIDTTNAADEYGAGSDIGLHGGSLTGGGLTPDPEETNNTLGTATVLGTISSDRTDPVRTIHNSSDQDYFRFTAARSGSHTIRIDFTNNDGDLDLELIATNGSSIVLSESVNDFETITQSLTAGTDYIVRVYGYQGSTNSYTLSFDVPDPAADGYEQNNSFGTAFNLGTISSRDLTDPTIHTGADVDFYRFTASQTGRGEVAIDFDDAAGNLSLAVYSGGQALLGSSVGASNREQVVFDMTAGQTYYIRVDSVGTDVNDYDLSFRTLPLATDITLAGFEAWSGRWNSSTIDPSQGTAGRLVENEGWMWDPDRTYLNVGHGDFNNDGRVDLIGRDASTGRWYVSLGVQPPGESVTFGTQAEWGHWEGWKANANWVDVQLVDLNGDGRTDVLGLTSGGGFWAMYANASGTGFLEEQFIGGLSGSETWVDVQTGDFTADGRIDIVARSQSGGGWWGLVRNSANTGYQTPRWMQAWSSTTPWANVMAGDIDNDGVTDLIGQATAGGGWYVMRGNPSGGGFLPEQWVQQWNPAHDFRDVELIDMNGDDLLDVIGRNATTGEWMVMRSTSSGGTWNGFANETAWATWSTPWQLRLPWLNTRYGDFDADGDIDVLTQANQTGSWWLLRGNGSGTGFLNGIAIQNDLPNQAWQHLAVVDIDPEAGTPRMELLGLGQWSQVWTRGRLNSGNAYLTARTFDNAWLASGRWNNIAEGDFNGDGRLDVVGHDNRTGTWQIMYGSADADGFEPMRDAQFWWENWQLNTTWSQLQVGDINGDGRDDVVIRNANGAFYGMVGLAEGFGEEFFINVNTLSGASPSLTAAQVNQYFLSDVNGDGRDDLTLYNATNRTFYYAAARAGSNGFWRVYPSEQWNPTRTWIDIQAGDINGDGQADLVGRAFEGGGWYAMLAKPNGTGYQTERYVGSFDPSQQWTGVFLTDVTGDGLADIVGRSRQTGQWLVLAANGQASLFEAVTVWGTWDGWRRTANWHVTETADVNGDGRSDILAREAGGAWYVMLANNSGTGFGSLTWLGNWDASRTYNQTVIV